MYRLVMPYHIMAENVKINLLFFAKSRELVGSGLGELILSANSNFDALKQALLLKYPSLEVIADNIILSLNEEYIDDSQQLTLRESDEVAVIPPISGG
ncbi:molybdopterin synthase sulfur carrier subunit-like [Saccostrea cucullata]|uniref:molybdopterin synthase sulfur carrier subunit-like n=1 Tax=Saccostrea cuccullata TaxID=36930 RepID=UPI002ECFFF3A